METDNDTRSVHRISPFSSRTPLVRCPSRGGRFWEHTPGPYLPALSQRVIKWRAMRRSTGAYGRRDSTGGHAPGASQGEFLVGNQAGRTRRRLHGSELPAASVRDVSVRRPSGDSPRWSKDDPPRCSPARSCTASAMQMRWRGSSPGAVLGNRACAARHAGCCAASGLRGRAAKSRCLAHPRNRGRRPLSP